LSSAAHGAPLLFVVLLVRFQLIALTLIGIVRGVGLGEATAPLVVVIDLVAIIPLGSLSDSVQLLRRAGREADNDAAECKNGNTMHAGFSGWFVWRQHIGSLAARPAGRKHRLAQRSFDDIEKW
jgi:hypothetical protein